MGPMSFTCPLVRDLFLSFFLSYKSHTHARPIYTSRTQRTRQSYTLGQQYAYYPPPTHARVTIAHIATSPAPPHSSNKLTYFHNKTSIPYDDDKAKHNCLKPSPKLHALHHTLHAQQDIAHAPSQTDPHITNTSHDCSVTGTQTTAKPQLRPFHT